MDLIQLDPLPFQNLLWLRGSSASSTYALHPSSTLLPEPGMRPMCYWKLYVHVHTIKGMFENWKCSSLHPTSLLRCWTNSGGSDFRFRYREQGRPEAQSCCSLVRVSRFWGLCWRVLNAFGQCPPRPRTLWKIGFIPKIKSRITLFRIVLFYYRHPNSITIQPNLEGLSIPSLTASRRLARSRTELSF